MTTRFPTDLPPVPADRWSAAIIRNGGDPDEGTAYIVFTVQGDTAEQAEARALAYLDHDYEDDLRGVVATSIDETDPSIPGALPDVHHVVRVSLDRPR